MIRLAIVQYNSAKDAYDLVEADELTDTGLGQIVSECDRLKEKCEELHFALNADE